MSNKLEMQVLKLIMKESMVLICTPGKSRFGYAGKKTCPWQIKGRLLKSDWVSVFPQFRCQGKNLRRRLVL
jgi:hypothetical protein